MSVGYSTLCRNLHEWGYTRLRRRPKAHKADPGAQATFVARVRQTTRNDDPDIWFGDETSFGGDPSPHLIWAKKGSQPTIPYAGQHYRVSVVGAVRPRDGEFVALLVSTGNSLLFQVFLDELNRQINPAKRNILILDNASFHKVRSLNWGRIEPWFLPPYSPELNPIEEIWLLIKTNGFHPWTATSQEHLEDKVANALHDYIHQPQCIQSITNMSAYL
ncbi:MAG: IS630 family transposase [Calditrichaeota bacterium]|nr:IS630 family transposase [Calditrichota bacterium]